VSIGGDRRLPDLPHSTTHDPAPAGRWRRKGDHDYLFAGGVTAFCYVCKLAHPWEGVCGPLPRPKVTGKRRPTA
jgi:hypothetical protein